MRYLILLVLIITTSTASFSQYSKFSLNVNGGYTFKDKVNFDAAYAYVNEAFQYGGSLEYFTTRSQSIELTYARMDTEIPLYGATGSQLNKDAGKGSVNYILLGGNNYFQKSNTAKAMPFIGGGLGVGILNGRGESATKFAWNFKGGVKVKTSSAVSFKLQAYLQSMISTFGSDYWVTGGGNIIAVADYATLLQFGLGAAICIDFPTK